MGLPNGRSFATKSFPRSPSPSDERGSSRSCWIKHSICVATWHISFPQPIKQSLQDISRRDLVDEFTAGELTTSYVAAMKAARPLNAFITEVAGRGQRKSRQY